MLKTINDLRNIVSNMHRNAYNETCSECAERVKSVLGKRGTILTVVRVKQQSGQILDFRTEIDGELYRYHTVVYITIQGRSYVIDLTSPDKLMYAPDFTRKLLSLNPGGVFVTTKKSIDNKMLVARNVKELDL